MTFNHATEANADAIMDVELAPIQIGSKQDDPFLVVFTAPFDPDNPKDWRSSRKWAVTDVLSATGFNRIMVSTIMAPALSTIAKEFDMNSAESAMALSIYLLATAFGPLVIGPLSEVYGRKPILHASNIWFLIWNIACGFAPNKGVLIASRFFAGFGASAVYALANGVLGDVWRPEQRGRSLGVYLLIPLLGAAVGPIIGGFMAERATWRWMFWSTSIFQAVMVMVSFFSFWETHEPLILRKRAEQIRKETGDSRYYTADERIHANKSAIGILGRALIRPVRLLAFHPIIQIASLISAFYYGILYIVLSTFSDLWTHQYHESIEISGLHYIAAALGEIIGSQICAKLMDSLYHRLKARANGEHSPELRTPSIFPGALLGPLGLLIYGWAATYRLHWIVVDIGVFITMLGMQITSMPLQAYVMEAYPQHTSSAGGATQFLRSLTAFLFPLFAPRMYQVLGYGWGNTTIGLIGLVFGLPAPLVIWYYGAKLRAKAYSSY
ncbi:major facilitator superfamily domain-containing protein [Penicillium atrosanguineum]|uniref:Major facilitator superfamily domain-containing protein n=1 Tax=Penicillium atrosanguineum TaxID=1132637 RepID=A0A9W9H6W9_9EURO|nr:major facilitator superfamily domain-containing protein [Penicillium atrosanguineum]KAJ5139792.1 major facilitator superfamily domain-containing protein [Penicillium atrosanguineum]KAJ5315235.1 major facilitator superfamily domain-containing protein [Penicillium atrosanguineum]